MLKKFLLKVALRSIARALESRFPGLTPIIERIISFLLDGGNGHALAAHIEKFPSDHLFEPTGIKRN